MELSLSTPSIDTFLYPTDSSGNESGDATLNPKQTMLVRIHLTVPHKAAPKTITALTVTLDSKESLGVGITSEMQLKTKQR